MKLILLVLTLFISAPSFSQSIPQKIQAIASPVNTNASNLLLQELLDSDEKTLNTTLIPCVFFKGKSYELKGSINLKEAKKVLLAKNNQLAPYWKVKNTDKFIIILSGNGLWEYKYNDCWWILLQKEKRALSS